MNNQLTDAKIDELLHAFNGMSQGEDPRAIVRAWLPACPKRVRVMRPSTPDVWYHERVGEVFEVREAVYKVRVDGQYRPAEIDIADCEPVSDEA